MMKFKITLSLFLILSLCKLTKGQDSSGNHSIDLQVGYYNFDRELNSLNGLANPLNIHFDSPLIFSLSPSMTISSGRSSSYSDATSDTEYSFNYFQPLSQNNRLQTIKYTGYYVGFSKGFDLISKKKWVDLILKFGFNWGRKTLRIEEENTPEIKYRNVFFAPKARGELRFNMKPIALSFKTDYQLDITNPRWKHKKGANLSIDSTKFHGFFFYACIGYLLF